MTDPEIHAVFAYGTLKRGHERERFWPHPPRRISSAKTRGVLYDLGPFPALTHGSDWIRGECWDLAPADVSETLRALDEEEGFEGQPTDLYRRETIECWDDAGNSFQAYAYFLADLGLIERAIRIKPDESTGECFWPPVKREA